MENQFYILKDHKAVPCSIKEWGEAYKDDTHRRVAFTKIGEIEVSTVFLGINYAFDDRPPLLFETMVFGGPLDQEQERYSTWEQAEIGHRFMCKKVRRMGNSTGICMRVFRWVRSWI